MSSGLKTILRIDNIRVKAYHGWYESERKIGGMYSISIKITKMTAADTSFQDINQTINYEEIHTRVVAVMKEEFKLIEHCCKTLFDNLKPLGDDAQWEVTLVKEEVPIKHVGYTSFTVTG
ncbi:MAG: hypothetical protein COA58_02010 [Bacteroidetes bacterium]|nr:MAG: hypothetical protein COA58_02010 [Bacteroidota bacterium]